MRSPLLALPLVLAALSPLEARTEPADASVDPPTAKPIPVQELKKISVTATRGEREIDSIAGTVTVIDAARIESELASDIKDLIRYEPGISVSNAATRFGLSGFNIRGIEGNRVLVRLDGVPMAEAFSIGSFSDARRNLIDLEMVKSVEIIRGAASALYGSDAIGGVVSFLLKEPEDYLVEGRSFDAAVRSGYQSEDEGWFAGGRLALGRESLSGLLHYAHREGHEGDNRGTLASLDRTRTKPNPQRYDSDSVLAKLSWSPHDDHLVRLTFEGERNNVDTNVLSSVGLSGTNYIESLRGDDEQTRSRLSLDHEWFLETPAFDSLKWLLYAQDSEVEQRTYERRFSTLSGPPSTVLRERVFNFDQSVFGAEVVFRKELELGATAHRLTYGLDFIDTETEQLRDGVQTHLASGARTSNIPPDEFPVRDFPRTRTREYAFYVQDEIGVGADWLIVPGVRVDRYELDPKRDWIFEEDNPGVATSSIEETSVSPKLGLVRSFGEHYSVFAQYARGFRAPPYNDVNIGFTNLAFGYTAIANPDLKPETSNGYELGLRGNFGSSFLSASAFYNDYDDFIESLAMVGIQNGLVVFQSRNVDEARIYGAELRGGLALSAFSPRLEGWMLKSSVAWARGEDSVTDRPLNSVEPLKGVLGVSYSPSGNWGIELIATAVDRPSHVDHGDGELFVPAGYVTLDLLAHAQFGERLRVNVGIFNLTDEKYWEWSDVRGRSASDAAIDRYTRPGLNASASATVRF